MLKRGTQLLLSYWPSERGPDFSEKLIVETVQGLAKCGSYKELQWVLDDEMLVRRLRPTAIQVLFFDSLYDADIDYALGCIRTLLELGADPNWPNQHGITPLMIAILACNDQSFEVSRILLCFGADPAATDCGGVTEDGVVVAPNTALGYARRATRTATAELLAAVDGWPALKISVACRHPADARTALRTGHIGMGGMSRGALLKVALSTSPLGPRCPDHAVCADTVALIKQAMSPWSPETHMLYDPEFRGTIRVVMLVATRLDQTRANDINWNLWLPLLMWQTVCSFLIRGRERQGGAATELCADLMRSVSL